MKAKFINEGLLDKLNGPTHKDIKEKLKLQQIHRNLIYYIIILLV
jgi:hypothetical protein